MNSIVEAAGVTKIYREGASEVHALRDLNLAVGEGETLAITGASGSGKSTLLHVLGLLDTPTQGVVSYRGTPANSLTSTEMADIRNRHFGFVFQFFHLLPDLNALENVMLPDMVSSDYYMWRRKEKQKTAEQALDMVGLAQRMRHKPSQLSGGEKQRVAIARALVKKPDVIFCDEPTGNLDSKTSGEIHNLIIELNRTTRQTFVIVTHDPTLASQVGRVARMEDGRIDEIVSNSSSPDSAAAVVAGPAT